MAADCEEELLEADAEAAQPVDGGGLVDFLLLLMLE